MGNLVLILTLFLFFKDCSGSTAIRELKEPVEKIGKELHSLNEKLDILIKFYKTK